MSRVGIGPGAYREPQDSELRRNPWMQRWLAVELGGFLAYCTLAAVVIAVAALIARV
jgi:hypothetical protein